MHITFFNQLWRICNSYYKIAMKDPFLERKKFNLIYSYYMLNFKIKLLFVKKYEFFIKQLYS